MLLFAAVSATFAALASFDDRHSDTQVNMASAAWKRHRPGAYAYDPVFGPSKHWLFHTPAVQGILEMALVPTDYQDLRLPFRALAGVLTMLYLCGMYALLYGQCRSWSVAAFVSVLSVRVIETLAGGYWGLGSLASITPAAACLACFPLVALALRRYAAPPGAGGAGEPWRLLLVFGVVGLLGNIHLVTAMNMTLVMLVAYAARQRFAPRCLPMVLACGLCAFLAASPYTWYYFSLRASLGHLDPAASAETAKAAFAAVGLDVLYPDVLKPLIHWRTLAGALVLVVPAAAVLGLVERFRTRDLGMWLALALGSVVTALGLHALSQGVGRMLGTPPPVIDFPQAASLLMLPLYVLLAQAITNVFRLIHGGGGAVLRWVLAALMVAWMLPADNLQIPRYAAAEGVLKLLPGGQSGDFFLREYVDRHRAKADRRRELSAIAAWARPRRHAVFLTDRGSFRMLARQSIVTAPQDVRYVYYLTPGRLAAWHERFLAQHARIHPATARADGTALAGFAEELRRQDPVLADAERWFVILPAEVAPEKPGPLEPIDPRGWGEQFQLYRIP